jgi:hypothetical protein
LGISPIFLFLSPSLFLIFTPGLTKEFSVPVGNTDEVGEQSQDDDGSQKLSEDVVLLLELEVTGLRSSPSIVDVFLLVDPYEVDDSPSSNQGGGDDNKNATTGESASVCNVVLTKPNDEEGSTSVSGNVENNVDKWVPPLNLIVKHKEELLGNLDSNEYNGEHSNECDTSFQGNQKAADLFLGKLIGAMANATAALLVDGLIIFLFELIEIILLWRQSNSKGVAFVSIWVLISLFFFRIFFLFARIFLLLLLFRLLVLLLISLICISLIGVFNWWG